MFLSLLAQLAFCQKFRRADGEVVGCFFLINLGIAGQTAMAGRVLSGLQCHPGQMG